MVEKQKLEILQNVFELNEHLVPAHFVFVL